MPSERTRELDPALLSALIDVFGDHVDVQAVPWRGARVWIRRPAELGFTSDDVDVSDLVDGSLARELGWQPLSRRQAVELAIDCMGGDSSHEGWSGEAWWSW